MAKTTVLCGTRVLFIGYYPIVARGDSIFAYLCGPRALFHQNMARVYIRVLDPCPKPIIYFPLKTAGLKNRVAAWL